jgi:hypothetical protein
MQSYLTPVFLQHLKHDPFSTKKGIMKGNNEGRE